MVYQNDNIGKSYDFRSGWHSEFVVYEHIHDYSEILMCLNGEADITVRSKKMILKKGHTIQADHMKCLTLVTNFICKE